MNWFEHYLLGRPFTAANQSVVSVCAGNGSREQFLAGNLTRVTGAVWPLAGTQWNRLYLSATASGSAASLNDGTLSLQPSVPRTNQPYLFVPSLATETDVHNIATVAGQGLDQAAGAVPAVTDMQLSDPSSLTYTSPPLKTALTAVGPGSLDVYLSSSQAVSDIYVVVADVSPNGTAYPVASGALRTVFPNVDLSRSLIDSGGDIVDPYNLYDTQSPALPGATREYHVELLPMGNTFAMGHRVRVYVLGTPFDQMAAPPGVNTVSLGGPSTSRLLLPSVNGVPAFSS
jgi:putative CocE/NonD family hydrolase